MIRFENVHKTYKSGSDALRGVSFKIDDGEFVFIIGKSGSGKSTLIKLITREEKLLRGYVLVRSLSVIKNAVFSCSVLRKSDRHDLSRIFA